MAQGVAAICFTLAAMAGAVAAAAASTSPVTTVQVRDYAFSPSELTVVRNTIVRFTNIGAAMHRVVTDDGTFDTNGLQPGHNATFQFQKIGVYRIHCEFHPSMTGTITVVDRIASPVAPATGNSKTAAEALPRTLANTGSGTTMLSIVGLGLILLGMVFLAAGRNALIPIPVAARQTPSVLSLAMGWENRFDDLLPAREQRRSRV